MTQLELGMELKRKGKAKAVEHRVDALELARRVARSLAQRYGRVSTDDVRECVEGSGVVWNLGNAAGAIFDGPEWESVGYKASTRPSRHGGIIRVWRLK